MAIFARNRANESVTGAVTVLIALASMTPAPADGQGWSQPRTPDGQPDLQGVWLNNSATPLERPKALEGRQFLTDEEVIELNRDAAARMSAENRLEIVRGATHLFEEPGTLEEVARLTADWFRRKLPS